MGFDIHCYIEYRKPGEQWRDFGGRINPGRDYRVFARLAGVRGDGPRPKGRVPDMARVAQRDDWLYVVDEPTDGIRCCSRADAEAWVASGVSFYTSPDHRFVTDPDNHSHSWATPDEWEAAIEKDNPEYVAVLAALRSFEAQGFEARVVYWFDS